jgi:integration host factor subunit alpha
MTMTKAGLETIVYEKCGITRPQSGAMMELVFQILKETLEKGETVKISGFGSFITREKKPRKGRNPRTGEEILISARRVLTFKPSAVLQKTLNKEDQNPETGEIQE